MAKECPNRRAMVIMANGEIGTEEEKDSSSDSSEEIMIKAPEGDLLVARKVLNFQVKPEENEKRNNLFHTRCEVQGKVCSLTIDDGSCVNVASEVMVRKLGLKTTRRNEPSLLQWINESGCMKVTKQVLVPFSIGRYKAEVLCEVLPMGNSHLLLGRPWQSDQRVTHDGFTNQYSLKQYGNTITLMPMTQHKVYLDQKCLSKKEEDPNRDDNGTLIKHANDLMKVFKEKG